MASAGIGHAAACRPVPHEQPTLHQLRPPPRPAMFGIAGYGACWEVRILDGLAH